MRGPDLRNAANSLGGGRGGDLYLKGIERGNCRNLFGRLDGGTTSRGEPPMRRWLLCSLSVWVLCSAAVGQDQIQVERGKILGSAENLEFVGEGPDAKLFLRGEEDSKAGVLCTCTIEGKGYLWWVIAPGPTMVPFTSHENKILWEEITSGRHLITVDVNLEDDSWRRAWIYFEVGPPPPPPDPPNLTTKDVQGKESDGSINFTITASKPAPADVTFDYATEDGLAEAGKDYEATAGKGKILKGATSFSIAVPLIDDEESEPSESFSLLLTNIRNATPSSLTKEAIILDDDKPPVTELAGIIVYQAQDESQQDVKWSSIMYGPKFNDILGDDNWQPVDRPYDGNQEWISDLEREVTDKGLDEPYLFLLDKPTKTVVWQGPMSKDINEVEDLVKEHLP